jgi:glycosyltransferase involved in cell wall biosynthesis
MNPILMIAHNNLALTQQAVASVFAQDIPTTLYLINNGSTDGTADWMAGLRAPSPHSLYMSAHLSNISPLKIVNNEFPLIFAEGAEYVINMNNDQQIPPNCCRELAKWPRGFVCASDIGQRDLPSPPYPAARPVSESTPFGVILNRRWAYDALVSQDGYFYDEGFWLYAADCDMAVRRIQCGIRGVQLNIPFWHYGSATHRLAPSAEGDEMRAQAGRDMEYFERKWGFGVHALTEGIQRAPMVYTDGQPYDTGFELAE